MKPENLNKAILQIQDDYLKRQKTIENDIPFSGLTDVLQQRLFDYRSFVRTLETIREAVLELQTQEAERQ